MVSYRIKQNAKRCCVKCEHNCGGNGGDGGFEDSRDDDDDDDAELLM